MFRIILKYIIHLNFVVAISASLLAAGIAHIFNLHNYLYYGFFGFFSTLCVYNSQRLFKTKIGTKTPWLKWVDEHCKLITYLSIFSGFLAVFFFIKLVNTLTPTLFVLMSIGASISFFYVVRIGDKSIREFPHLKTHSIALTWTLVIVLFPILNENLFNWKIIIFVPLHYIYFVAVAIPFDIRDLEYDLPSQRTIPQVIGVRNAKIVSIVLLVITAIGLWIVSNHFLLNNLFIIAILSQILLTAFITEKQQGIYYAASIDAGISLLGISYLIIEA